MGTSIKGSTFWILPGVWESIAQRVQSIIIVERRVSVMIWGSIPITLPMTLWVALHEAINKEAYSGP